MNNDFKQQNATEGNYSSTTCDCNDPVQAARNGDIVIDVGMETTLMGQIIKGGIKTLVTLAAWELGKKACKKVHGWFKEPKAQDADDINSNQQNN